VSPRDANSRCANAARVPPWRLIPFCAYLASAPAAHRVPPPPRQLDKLIHILIHHLLNHPFHLHRRRHHHPPRRSRPPSTPTRENACNTRTHIHTRIVRQVGSVTFPRRHTLSSTFSARPSRARRVSTTVYQCTSSLRPHTLVA
jgi:hypothetical protein